MMKINWDFKSYALLGFSIVALDRITKLAALTYCVEQCRITSFFSFYLTFNRGISWGMFHESSDAVFVAITGMIVVFVALLAWTSMRRGSFGLAETLVVAGALGNIIDRFYYHKVIDFILFSYGSWAFPVFNIADAAIVLAAGVMLIKGWYE